jgi:hypothetical protein
MRLRFHLPLPSRAFAVAFIFAFALFAYEERIHSLLVACARASEAVARVHAHAVTRLHTRAHTYTLPDTIRRPHTHAQTGARILASTRRRTQTRAGAYMHASGSMTLRAAPNGVRGRAHEHTSDCALNARVHACMHACVLPFLRACVHACMRAWHVSIWPRMCRRMYVSAHVASRR